MANSVKRLALMNENMAASELVEGKNPETHLKYTMRPNSIAVDTPKIAPSV
jgi:hypothetical protein